MSLLFIFPMLGHPPSFHLPWNPVSRVSWSLGSYARVPYLFTRSDLKTILLPVTVFAYLSAPDMSTDRLTYAIIWTWFHLLQFTVSNQSLDPGEDASNKPWRPIPSGLISVGHARALRWVLLPACFFLSVRLKVHWQGISLALAFLAHNELHLHSHWLMRNVCNAWGYASFNAGASAIVAGQSTITTHTAVSFVINSLIIFSTIYAQDFRDEIGDRLMGRRTVPIVWPKGSRVWIFSMLTAWSAGLSWACDLSFHFSVPFSMLAVFIGLRFLRKQTADEDKLSYCYYNIWLAAAQVVHIPMVATALSRS